MLCFIQSLQENNEACNSCSDAFAKKEKYLLDKVKHLKNKLRKCTSKHATPLEEIVENPDDPTKRQKEDAFRFVFSMTVLAEITAGYILRIQGKCTF